MCIVKCLHRAKEGEREGYRRREEERTREIKKIERHRDIVREGEGRDSEREIHTS